MLIPKATNTHSQYGKVQFMLIPKATDTHSYYGTYAVHVDT